MGSSLVRFAVIRVVFVIVLTLLSMLGSAHAAPAAALPAVGAAREARVSGGVFKPTRAGDGIRWDARWILSADIQNEMADGEPRVILFAVPLPDGETLELAPGTVPVVTHGRLVALRFDRAAVDGRTIHAVLHQRVSHDGAPAAAIGAPIAAGTAVQIVDADLGGSVLLEIQTGPVIERRLGHIAPPGVGNAAFDEARRLTSFDARVGSAPLYVRGDDVKTMNGLTGIVVTPRARGRNGAIAVAAAFAAIVAALLFAMKRLRHQASIEHADAVLAAEVDSLDAIHRTRAR